MSLRNGATVRSEHPVAAEFALVTAALVGVFLWQRVLRLVSDPISAALGSFAAFDGLLVQGLATGSLFLGGLVALAVAYTAYRDVEVGLALPSRTDLPAVGLALLAPAVFVGVTKAVGALTGVTYSSLSNVYFGGELQVRPVLVVVGLGLFVGVPSLVVVCQVLVQGSFRTALGGGSAVVLTTLVAGFAMLSDAGGLATAPDPGKLVGAALFVLLLGVALYVPERVDDDRWRYVASLPVLAFVAVVVVSGVLGTESVAHGLFTLAHLGVLGVAAYTYERSDSLVVPALAYLSLSVAGHAVVVFLEAGGVPLS